MEEWKIIEGYNGRYSVSNEGRVRNNEVGNFLKLGKEKNGYEYYTLAMNQKTQKFSRKYLLATYWRYEWIKELRDGEEAKELCFDSRYFITNQGRLWSNVDKMGWCNPTKVVDRYYYRYIVQGKQRKVHRLVGIHFLPDFSPELEVCHHNEELPVDKINCVENLFMGTPRRNAEDCLLKGRRHYSIPVDEVWEMRRRYSNSERIVDIARHYGRSREVVSQMLHGVTYKWVR